VETGPMPNDGEKRQVSESDERRTLSSSHFLIERIQALDSLILPYDKLRRSRDRLATSLN
jgi:hypothetical protein